MRLMNDEKDGLMFLWKNYHTKHPNISVNEFLRSGLKNEIFAKMCRCNV
jgi:hypothetical protein